jgi:acyl carrier protein
MSAQAVLKQDKGEDLASRILALADAVLAKKGRPAAALDQDLREAGLSSLDTVNLMLAVEGEFDLFLPQAEMTPENFRTAAAIAAMVDRLA